MHHIEPVGSDTIVISPDSLLSAAPQFYAAGNTMRNAASNLHTAIAHASSSWDGDAQKQLNSLGDSFVKNLADLAKAMDTIADNLNQGALLSRSTDEGLARLIDANS